MACPLFVVVPMSNVQLSRSERIVLKVIIKKGSIRSDELYEQLDWIPSRTVSTAAASLREKGLLRKLPDLSDMRRAYFVLSEELASRLKARMEAPIAP